MGAPNPDYELLTEHLGYPPVALLDDIINTVNVLSDRALTSIEKLLLSIPPKNLGFPTPDAAKLEIEQGTHQLETLLTASLDRNFDKFELYCMKNILTVPAKERPFVRLRHYEGLDFDAAETTTTTTTSKEGPARQPSAESITGLRRRLQASQSIGVRLGEEKARNEALLRDLRAAMGVKKLPDGIKDDPDAPTGGSAFGFLRDKAGLESGGSRDPVTTTTQFTLSQLQSLQQLSGSLRALLPQLAEPAGGAGEGDGKGRSSWRSERSNYVESTSRKYLENVEGLELGEQGEVRDGEYQGQGRNLMRGEVEGLERVAAVLGSAAGPAAAEAVAAAADGGEDSTTGGEPMEEGP
ncbi:hypothetical protein N3K66_007460 [Trichothecium roseum]|uniref:Uncharacterized protein n=1 Tax=Trichothecium roseum TaxID=47278 RepID=A0ACC0UTY1_9HYPO|nr:hypothetical protein N3K66_007460 [Trichothecium roseum]